MEKCESDAILNIAAWQTSHPRMRARTWFAVCWISAILATMRDKFRTFDDEAKKKFLELFAVSGRMTECAHTIGFLGQTVTQHRKKDPDFAAAFEEALQQYRDSLENVIHSRAVNGVIEPIFQRGMLVGHKTNYSDTLLLAMAKRHIPEFREKHQVDVNHSGGVLVVPGLAKDSHEWERGSESDDEG